MSEAKKRVVVVHPEFGIYVGSCLGMGFWTKLDCAGQDGVVSFEDEADARDFISGWEQNGDPSVYTYHEVVPDGDAVYCTAQALVDAGLEDHLGEMAHPGWANQPGHC